MKAALESPFCRGSLIPPSALLCATFYATYKKKKKKTKHNMQTVSCIEGLKLKDSLQYPDLCNSYVLGFFFSLKGKKKKYQERICFPLLPL